uniref:Uncharacterized protein n=1 Tax=Catagonus wagneri TaxID=51154 RepID=A0A8C3YAH0_9CETA
MLSVPCRNTKEISELRSILQQLQPGMLGRSACMVLSAARKAPPACVSDPQTSQAEPGPSHHDSTEPRAEEQNSANDVGRTKRRKVRLHFGSRCPFRLLGVACGLGAGPALLTSFSPLPAGSFSLEELPQHASWCGETTAAPPTSPWSSPPASPSILCVSPESSPPGPWIQCPLCQLPFPAGEIEEHASMCREVPQA